MITFDEAEDAIAEAQWCTNTYGTDHYIISLTNGFGVCSEEDLEGHERILEITRAQVKGDTNAAHDIY